MLGFIVDDSVSDRLPAGDLVKLESQLTRMLEAAWKSEDTEEELEADPRLTDDDTIHALNRDYRDMDKPTDVLAFAQREGEGGDLMPHILGDIVISMDTAARQAKVNLYEELVFLASHGLCHLLGYDHQDDEEEAEMNARMALLLEESRREGPVNAA